MLALIILLLYFPQMISTQSIPQTNILNLRTEYKVNPVGIDVMQPRLSWEILADRRDVGQSAYHLRCAVDMDDLQAGKNLIWDTGKIVTSQSNQVVYQGPALQSGQRVFWQVCIWDDTGEKSQWSKTHFWEMGLLNPADWQADWIEPGLDEDIAKSQPCPMLRKEFNISKEIESASVYVSSLGLYQMSLNGKKVDDQLFTPGWTSYNKRLQYQVYDITNDLKTGQNAVAVILGDGWYRGFLGWGDNRNSYGDRLALLLQINVKYKDGSSERIISDESWKAATGPILSSDIYNGEIYDARLEKKGWRQSGYNDNQWSNVKPVKHSKDILVASMGPAVRKIEEIKPVQILTTPAGETVYDMGQNMVGWIRLQVKGETGTTITLRHAEVLDKEGNLYTENLRSAKQSTQYILKGDGQEVFEPHFTFQGFRYVAVEGLPEKATLDNLTGIVIHSDMTPVGHFSCSNDMINQLQHNIVWGLKGNFLDVPTDCPQRDERMGWTGDAQVFAPTACFLMDAASFYSKWMKDFIADQKKDGRIPHVIPNVINGAGATGWADAAVIIPWNIYLNYGDKRILEQQYESMKSWVNYMKKQAGQSYLWRSGKHFGDWLAFATTKSDYPGATTDKDFLATAYFYYSTTLLQKSAALLGKEQDANYYSKLMQKIKAAFSEEFLTSNGRLSSNTQTAYVLALAFDLIPKDLKAKAAQRLADDVKKFGHITTGFLGTPLICQVLTDNGYTDLAYMLLLRKEYPSWLYPVSMGATTIWERWDGLKPDGSFQDKGMNSFNHYAYGAVGKWLYSYVAGIRIDEKQPGYKHILIQPRPGGDLTYASASTHSMYGEVTSSWKVENNQFILEINIPANSWATATLPGAKLAEIKESGKALVDAEGIRKYNPVGDDVVVEFGSGHYQFVYTWEE